MNCHCIAVVCIKLTWFFCSFVLVAPHTYPHFWTDQTTQGVTPTSTLCHLLRLPPPFQRHTSPAEWLHRLTSPHCHVRVCVANTRVYMWLSSRRFTTCFVLCPLACVCVHRRVVAYSGHFLLRYSYGNFLRNLLNVCRRLFPLTCVCSCVSQTPHGYIFREFRSSLL
jgi:hypothetical protein